MHGRVAHARGFIGSNIATKVEIADLETGLIRWLVGTMLVFFSADLAVTVALITFLESAALGETSRRGAGPKLLPPG